MTVKTKFRIVAATAACALALSASTSAPAAVKWMQSGAFDYSGISADIDYLPAGQYVFSWASTAPVSTGPFGATVEDFYYFVFNMYFEDGTYMGGDEDLLGQMFDLAPSAADDPYHYSKTFTVSALPPDHNIYYPSGALKESDIYLGLRASINLYPMQDSGYFTASISSIPEPGVWTLTLLGFAALGIVGRHGSRRKTQAVPAIETTKTSLEVC